MIKLLESGPWKEPREPNKPLGGAITADVAIVGAGVTGLSTALELAERGFDVVVLEKNWVGAGASGLNAGHQATAVNEQLLMIKRLVGEQALREYIAVLNEAVAYMTDFIQHYAIDCDHKTHGSLLAGTSEKHHKKVKAMVEEVSALGGNVRFADNDEMRERDLPSAFNCAMWGEGGSYNPYKYVNGLREAAEKAGVRLYEGSDVIDMQRGDEVVLKTADGQITAKQVFLATNAYTPHLKFKTISRRRILPVYPTMVETEELSDEQWQRIGWSGGEAICTAHSMIESYHPSASSKSIILGTLSPQIGFSSAMNYRPCQKVLATQEAAFRRRFPMLDDVKIKHGWGGWVGMTTNFMPMCNKLEGSDNIFYAMAYQGHGVPKATLMGKIAADMMAGKQYRSQHMFTQQAPNWPVEPLRYAGFYGVAKVSSLLDRLEDPLPKTSKK